jgi:GNAT superfamily N-acetyltransferase
VSPLADKSLLADLSARRYRPVELTTVLFQPLTARTPEQTGIAVRIAGEEERDVWARTMAEGWRGFIENTDSMLALARVSAARQGATDFLAELDGHPIAAGSLCIHQGVALLAGASTIEAWRGRGAQRALLEGRLAYAADLGCELAMMGAEPGSASQRNAERAGFHIAYTRIKWELAFA